MSDDTVGVIFHDNHNPIPMHLVIPKPGTAVDDNVRRTLARGSEAESADLAFVDFPALDSTDDELGRQGRVLCLAVNANGNRLGLPENRPASALVRVFSDGEQTWTITGEAVLCVRDRETSEVHGLPEALASDMAALFNAVSLLARIPGVPGSGAGDGGPFDGFGFPLSPN